MHWIIAGLDRGRFHWSDDVPGWPQGVCLFTVGSGYALALWAMRVNRFFSSVIHIQTDRGQRRWRTRALGGPRGDASFE
jgi:hypothetical protein